MLQLLFSTLLATILTGSVLSETFCEGPLKEWHKFGDSCYLIRVGISKGVSYYDAENFCRSKGAHLVSILSKEENNFLRDTISSHSYYYGRKWIGLNVLQGQNSYQWSDGQKFFYQNFIHKDQYKKESCFILYGNEGGWRPEHCGLQYTPICKIAATAVQPSPLPPFEPELPKGNCPSGWTQFGQRCYQFFGAKEADRLKFKEAKAACMNLGDNHDLASIHSMEEQAFLTERLYEFGTSAWIGFNYIENDQIGHDIVFGWTDNSNANFTYWTPGHPPRGTWKYCAYLNDEGFGKGQWMADYCDMYKRGFICQRPPDASIPEREKPTSKCGEDAMGFKDSCYRYYSTPQTWQQAETTCVQNGGHLFSISDGYEQNFLYGHIEAKSQSLWTGLRNLKNTRIFKWSNGKPLYYSNWANSQPDVSDLQSSCVSTLPSDLLEWNVTKCDTQMPFICETSEVTPPPLPEDVIGDCLSETSSWFDIGDNYCYEESQEKTKRGHWGDNSRYCMSRGMEMISISTDHQLRSLFSYLWKRNSNYWLGLIRSFDKDKFIWIDGSPLKYTNWAENEPSAWSKSYKKDCVSVLMNDLRWYPTECSDWGSYLCRVKKTISGTNTAVARFSRSVNETPAAAPIHKNVENASQNSGPVGLLIAAIVCMGLSVFVAAIIFAWKRRNDVTLPTRVVPVTTPSVSSNQNSYCMPKF